MWPLLRPGDVARVEPLAGPARAGDIVVYVDPVARLVAHRVIETCPDGRLRLRGDFAFTAEAAPIEPRRIVGRLTSVERAGHPVALDGPFGRLLAFGLPRLERAAPGALAGLRHSVIRAVQLADGLWTAAPVRRLRRWGAHRPQLLVRVAQPGDADRIRAHVRACGRNPSDFVLPTGPNPDRLVVIAERQRDQRIVGFGFADSKPAGAAAIEWRIRDVHVPHWWRGLGIGSAITVTVVRAIQDGSGASAGQIAVQVEPGRAERMFGSLGFEPDECQSNPEATRTRLVLPLPLPPTRLAHIVAALCRTPSHG